MVGIVKGTGSYVPSRILENEDIAKLVDTSDAWIRERTGVERRHIIENETTVSMEMCIRDRCRSGVFLPSHHSLNIRRKL